LSATSQQIASQNLPITWSSGCCCCCCCCSLRRDTRPALPSAIRASSAFRQVYSVMQPASHQSRKRSSSGRCFAVDTAAVEVFWARQALCRERALTRRFWQLGKIIRKLWQQCIPRPGAHQNCHRRSEVKSWLRRPLWLLDVWRHVKRVGEKRSCHDVSALYARKGG
jgi:hypothetical protein